MPGKRATKTNNLLKKDTFNDIQQRLEKLEAMIANAYKRDHQSQVLVRNNESFDWDQFTLVILNSPIPTTGPHFNESKLITASRTPDLHVYDPDLTYAVVQFKTSQVVNSVPGIGPGVVLGLTNALFVSGADDSKPFAIPTTEAGKFDTTDSATPFKLHGIDSATNIGKIIMLGNSGTGAGDCLGTLRTEVRFVSSSNFGCVGLQMRTYTVFINSSGCLQFDDGDWSDVIDVATCAALAECCTPNSSSGSISNSPDSCCAEHSWGDAFDPSIGDLLFKNYTCTPTYLESGTTFTIDFDVENVSGGNVTYQIKVGFEHGEYVDYISATPTPDETNICYNPFGASGGGSKCVTWDSQAFTTGETKSYSATFEFNGCSSLTSVGDVLTEMAINSNSYNPTETKADGRIGYLTVVACESSSASASGPASSSASAPPP